MAPAGQLDCIELDVATIKPYTGIIVLKSCKLVNLEKIVLGDLVGILWRDQKRRLRRFVWGFARHRAEQRREPPVQHSLMDGGTMASEGGLPMVPPPPPTFRAPTRDSVLLQRASRTSALATEEDLSFMDAEVLCATPPL